MALRHIAGYLSFSLGKLFTKKSPFLMTKLLNPARIRISLEVLGNFRHYTYFIPRPMRDNGLRKIPSEQHFSYPSNMRFSNNLRKLQDERRLRLSFRLCQCAPTTFKITKKKYSLLLKQKTLIRNATYTRRPRFLLRSRRWQGN